MFLESSRYHGLKVVKAAARDGREVSAVALRKLPEVNGEPTLVKGNDRLDRMAGRRYGDAARFWYIADANRELRARRLVAETARVINVPEK